ncbi:autotransporter outer membrane beta-barrel domain-containing protein [Pontibacter sp. CAU 1760]
MKKLCLLLLLVIPCLAQAQSKITSSTAIWPELQVSYGTGEDGLLFFRNQYRINTDARYNDLQESGILSQFERIELAVGYEHALTDHWRGGALVRYALENYPKMLFVEPFLRHTGSVGQWFFNKQAMATYLSQEDRNAQGRFSLSAEVGQRFPLRHRFITPSISYEGTLFSDFNQGERTAAQERAIDRTRLRLNLTCELNDKLRITPYFMRQTDYYYVLIPPKYDEQEQLLEEGYTTKRNRISPIVGLELKYTFNKAMQPASIAY